MLFLNIFLNRQRLSKALFLLFLLAQPTIYAFRFVVYGDCRAPKNDPRLFNHQILGFINSQIVALDPKPDFVLFLGDMVNRGTNTTYTHSNLVNWLAFMQAGLGSIPIYTAIGNTDLYGNTGWIEYPVQLMYQQVFSFLPDNGPADYKYLAYSFEFGEGEDRTLFVVLDAFGFYNVNGTWIGFDNGYDTEQIEWFDQQARLSTAKRKIVLTHAPAFSVEGFPISSSVADIWNVVLKYNFDMFYCGHEHIYSRWLKNIKEYPASFHPFIQTIVGSAGATPDSASSVKVNPAEAHIYSGYTYIVVDIEDGNFIQQAYKVVSNGSELVSQYLDKLISL